jgi:hypothetical protein
MNYDKINPNIIASIRRYADEHCPTGGFLEAVLSNDLKEAVGRADDENIRVIPEIVCYCYNEIPNRCWGSPERVRAWLEQMKDYNRPDESVVQKVGG